VNYGMYGSVRLRSAVVVFLPDFMRRRPGTYDQYHGELRIDVGLLVLAKLGIVVHFSSWLQATR